MPESDIKQAIQSKYGEAARQVAAGKHRLLRRAG